LNARITPVLGGLAAKSSFGPIPQLPRRTFKEN
jgi:hypothetical protein